MSARTFATIAAAVILAAVSTLADARSRQARAHFQHEQPCPVNGKRSGKCPGYVVDHVVPLACGGADASSNMQWQTKAAGKAKDKWERRGCRS